MWYVLGFVNMVEVGRRSAELAVQWTGGLPLVGGVVGACPTSH